MKPEITDHKIGHIIGPTGRYAGYFMMIFGVVASIYNLTGLIIIIAGMFLAFTCLGTKVDYSSRRLKSYICFFGLFPAGKWISADNFRKFRIYKSRRRYVTYSRAGVPLDLNESDVRLELLGSDSRLKITINKYKTFGAAREEMSELIRKLQISELNEWTR
jgi:hypothetical protein